jgi:glutamine amidotransferase
VAGTLSVAELLGVEARVDSALLWALVLRRLRAGLRPGQALRETLTLLTEAGATGRFNFLLTDGHVIAASCVGDTLSYKLSEGAIVVASEPYDDEPGWTDVREGSVICADTEGVVLL